MSQAKAPSEREKRESVAVARRKEQPAVKRTKVAKPVAETRAQKTQADAQPKRTRSKPVDIPKPAPTPRKPRQAKPSSDEGVKAERAALKLKLQQLLEEL